MWTVFQRAIVVAIALGPFLVAGCGEDDEVAREREAVPSVTPTALAGLPGGVEVAELTIVDGEFDVGELILQEDEPTVLNIVNHDDRTYRFRIGDVLTPTEIAADTTTRLEFTTPNPNHSTGQLLAANTDDVLDEINVLILAPGQTNP